MPADRSEIRALTGIRGYAALWVVLFHLKWNGLYDAFPALEPLRPLGDAGFLGVDLFFTLSGFILTWNYLGRLDRYSRREHVRFELLRLARIYPVHVATLGLMAVVVAISRLTQAGGPWLGPRFNWPALASNAALVHAWLPGRPTWNVPSWSISAEWAAYLAFPLLLPLVARVRSGAAALVAGIALLVAMPVASRALGFGDALNTDNPGGLVRIAFEFPAGCLLCRAFVLAGTRAAAWSRAAIPCAAAILVLAATGHADPWIVPLFGVLVASLAADAGTLARFLGTRWNLLWGRASYSLYMTHWLVLSLVAWLWPHDFPTGTPLTQRLGWFAGAGASTALVALAMWRFVEEPGRRLVRRWTEPGPRTPSASR